MTEYFQSIFIISLTGAITEALVSVTSNNSKTLESGLKLVFSLCLLLSVVIPAADLLKNAEFPDFSEIREGTHITAEEHGIISMTKKETEKNIAKIIYDKFGIKPVSVSIELDTEETENTINVDIKDINITLEDCHNEYKIEITDFAKKAVGINQESGGDKNEN